MPPARPETPPLAQPSRGHLIATRLGGRRVKKPEEVMDILDA
jgi:hypothetical protein